MQVSRYPYTFDSFEQHENLLMNIVQMRYSVFKAKEEAYELDILYLQRILKKAIKVIHANIDNSTYIDGEKSDEVSRFLEATGLGFLKYCEVLLDKFEEVKCDEKDKLRYVNPYNLTCLIPKFIDSGTNRYPLLEMCERVHKKAVQMSVWQSIKVEQIDIEEAYRYGATTQKEKISILLNAFYQSDLMLDIFNLKPQEMEFIIRAHNKSVSAQLNNISEKIAVHGLNVKDCLIFDERDKLENFKQIKKYAMQDYRDWNMIDFSVNFHLIFNDGYVHSEVALKSAGQIEDIVENIENDDRIIKYELEAYPFEQRIPMSEIEVWLAKMNKKEESPLTTHLLREMDLTLIMDISSGSFDSSVRNMAINHDGTVVAFNDTWHIYIINLETNAFLKHRFSDFVNDIEFVSNENILLVACGSGELYQVDYVKKEMDVVATFKTAVTNIKGSSNGKTFIVGLGELLLQMQWDDTKIFDDLITLPKKIDYLSVDDNGIVGYANYKNNLIEIYLPDKKYQTYSFGYENHYISGYHHNPHGPELAVIAGSTCYIYDTLEEEIKRVIENCRPSQKIFYLNSGELIVALENEVVLLNYEFEVEHKIPVKSKKMELSVDQSTLVIHSDEKLNVYKFAN